MVKYSNPFAEASRRMKDFKERGFIPEGSKYVYEDFKREVLAENRGEYYEGAYTKNAYNKAYNANVDYFESTTFQEILDDELEKYLEKYKKELLDIYDKNDFIHLAERWGNRFNFDPNGVLFVDSLEGLVQEASNALNVEPYLFRNERGRNRRTESSEYEIYANEFASEINVFIDEVNGIRMRYDFSI